MARRGESPAPSREELEAREAFRRDKELDDLKNILADPRVRALCWRVLARAGMFSNPFNTNAAVMGFNCGQMNIGQWLWTEIESANPEVIALMLEEGQTRRCEERAQAELRPAEAPIEWTPDSH